MRLELKTLIVLNIRIFLFQFHKGAIRTKKEHEANDKLRNFNSIKVRLERGGETETGKPDQGFQFHKGAIRTHSPVSVAILLVDFNSIKVRLEHAKDDDLQF